MMEKDEIFYYLALQAVTGIGPVKAKKLLKHFEGAKQILTENEKKLKQLKGIGTHVLKQLKNPVIFEKAEKEMRFIEANGILAIPYGHESYPSKLKHCPDAPLVLFKKGNFNINEKKIISIVGTRRMTTNGRQFLKDFIRDIKKYDPIIVSGLAYGIDICAHQESLENDICTIGVLAHGLDRVYPKSHAGIADHMQKKGGLYSEFWSGSPPDRENFVKRNRIIAGMSEATIVVESSNRGGSLITSELAFSYHRDVFAVPGRICDTYSQGCNMLIKSNKAAMITSVKDLEYVLGWSSEQPKPKYVQKKLLIALSEDEKRLYNLLGNLDKWPLDLISIESGFTVQNALSLLLQLELKGMVISHPGKMYQAV